MSKKHPYFIEVWLNGFVKDYLRSISRIPSEKFHPHITLVRPFCLLDNESVLERRMTYLFQDINLIQTVLEGKGTFENQGHRINYVPVTFGADKLIEISDDLESGLEDYVNFVPKPEKKKTMHVTVDVDGNPDYCPRIDYLIRNLTVIRDKLIWFSYDLENKVVLGRRESLEYLKGI